MNKHEETRTVAQWHAEEREVNAERGAAEVAIATHKDDITQLERDIRQKQRLLDALRLATPSYEARVQKSIEAWRDYAARWNARSI